MRIVQRWLIVTIIALLAISLQPFGSLAAPGPDRGRGSDEGVERDSQSQAAPQHQLIVRLKPDARGEGVTPLLDDTDSESDLARDLAQQASRGLQSHHALTSTGDLQVFTYDNPNDAETALEALQDNPAVEFVEPNYTRELHWVPDDEEFFNEQSSWVETIGLPEAWNITTGDSELVVAVVDSGVSPTHPDLVDKLVPGHNAVDGSDNAADINGHGTHIAGIIAASGDNNVGTAGVAMDVKIMPVRVMADNGTISVTSIYDGIVWAVDNGADVINVSFGNDKASETEHSAIQYAYEHNVPAVASSGNTFNRISYPASYAETISVGALDEEGNRVSFSSILSKVDIAAPGVDIFSTDWDERAGDSWSDQLNGRPVSGTSFSAAIVSGTVALQKSINPNLSVEDIRTILKGTAIDSGQPGLESGVGAGQLDAEAAVRRVAFMAMYDTWFPTDYPVASGEISRTWLWGTDPPAEYAYEPYDETQHGTRLVYYYDKSRMEITDPLHDRDADWYITNGLLVNELISGELQVGDNSFETRQPAAVNVAGDSDDTQSPTYASFTDLLDAEPLTEGSVITQSVSRNGDVGADERFAVHNVLAAYLDPTTNHRVADVFWNYLNSEGVIQSGDTLVTGRLFDPWFYATGLPVTEAYWAQVKVAGAVHDVLVQCFERRCMTYTPDNEPAWQVEMGNVGQHYYAWRYETDDSGEEPAPPPPPADQLLYESTLEAWPQETYTGGSTVVEDGAYHVEVTDSDGFEVAQFTEDASFTDIVSQVEVQMVGEAESSRACLVSRSQPGMVSGYLLCINGAGETAAYYRAIDSLGENVVITLLGNELRDAAQPVSAWNTLSIRASGTNIAFGINGTEIGTSTHAGASTGSIGIVVTNNDDLPAEYAFRNLSVRSAPPAS